MALDQDTSCQGLWANDVSYRYPNGTLAFQNLTLQLPPGSRTLLLGINGIGKTTLLRCLAGQSLTQSGSIYWNGESVFSPKTGKPKISLLESFFPFTVDIEISEILADLPQAPSPWEQELFRILGIMRHWRMNQISSGQRRRVQIYLQLRREPELICLDEITSDLDICVRIDLLNLFQEHESYRPTVIYATHILDQLLSDSSTSSNVAPWPTHILLWEQPTCSPNLISTSISPLEILRRLRASREIPLEGSIRL